MLQFKVSSIFPISDGTSPKMSNELEVTLPLDTAGIHLPPQEVRIDDDDLYKEYVEIREGSGIVPNIDHGKTFTDDALYCTFTVWSRKQLSSVVNFSIKKFGLSFAVNFITNILIPILIASPNIPGASEDAPTEAIVHMDLTTPQTTNATTPRPEPDTQREHFDDDLKGINRFSMQRSDKVVVATAAQEEGLSESQHGSRMLFIHCCASNIIVTLMFCLVLCKVETAKSMIYCINSLISVT